MWNWSAYWGSIWSNSTITTRLAGGLPECAAVAPLVVTPTTDIADATVAAAARLRILLLRMRGSPPSAEADPRSSGTILWVAPHVNGCVMRNVRP